MKYLLLILGAAFNVIGDVLLKRWSMGQNHIMWGVAAYAIDALIWAKILKDGYSMSSSLVIWESLVMMTAIAWAILVAGEKLSIMSMFGIILATAGIALVEYGQE